MRHNQKTRQKPLSVARLALGTGRIVATLCLAGAAAMICLGAMRFGPAAVLDPRLAWTRVFVFGSGATLLLIGALGSESATRFVPRLRGPGDASYSMQRVALMLDRQILAVSV